MFGIVLASRQDFSPWQHSVFGSMLLYFRKRIEWARPHLSPWVQELLS